MTLVGIGEFARISRLSPKALRLYDDLGLLPPAHVDPSSGYRSYDLGQLEVAGLVSALRQIDMPLARIKQVLALPPTAAASAVQEYWCAHEQRLVAQRELIRRVVDRLNGKKRCAMYDAGLRSFPARRLLCLLRHVDGDAGAFALGKEFVGKFRDGSVPRLEGADGAWFIVYYGRVDADGDGPIEFCRPIPADGADEIAARFPELTLRTEPAHDEVFVHLGSGPVDISPAQLEVVGESLQTWITEHGREPGDQGLRLTFHHKLPITETSRPECDFAIPLR